MYYEESLTLFSHFKDVVPFKSGFHLRLALVKLFFQKMEREGFHKNFNRLNYEWRGKPQTRPGPKLHEIFRSGVQTNGGVCLDKAGNEIEV